MRNVAVLIAGLEIVKITNFGVLVAAAAQEAGHQLVRGLHGTG